MTEYVCIEGSKCKSKHLQKRMVQDVVDKCQSMDKTRRGGPMTSMGHFVHNSFYSNVIF